MGRVYAARHGEMGIDVAIKVLTVREGSKLSGALREEVRAMARLDHPHIGRVFEHGVAEGGTFAAGTPWYAMELLRSDLMKALRGARDWSRLAPYVLQLLDALGHAHARGVIHRDLKAGNVLVGRSDDQRPGLKLVDFGIAALDADSPAAVGTPSAMTPEQWRSDLTTLGPWTDLYSLGAMVWRLVTGERSTGLSVGPGVYLRQKAEDFAPFTPRFPVPDGLEHWLRTALSFRPEERFACCADAQLALADCGALADVPFPQAVGPVQDLELTESSNVTVPVARWEADAPDRPLRPMPAYSSVPADWREPLPPPLSLHLAGAGLSLLPWREPAFVGREEARDALWEGTRSALRGGRVARMALVGPPGVGASALGHWWIRRLRSCSGTLAVVATDLQGLVDAMLQPFGRRGDHDARLRGLERWRSDFRASLDALDALDADAPVEQHTGAALELLRALSRQRPLAVFLEGTDPGVARLLARADELETGVALVVRGDVPPGAQVVSLRPMPDPELSEVVHRLLPLEPTLHGELLRRSGGLPGRARELLQQAVLTLTVTRDGFMGRLPSTDGADPLALLPDLSDAERVALEVAAAAGPSVLRAVWVRASGLAPRAADALADRLVRAGLSTPTPSGFSLTPSVADALMARAEAHGRGTEHHCAVATTVAHLRGDPLHVATSWQAAGEPALAAHTLLDGWHRVVRLHGTTMARATLDALRDRLRTVPEEEGLHGRAAALALELRLEAVGRVDPRETHDLQAWALARGWHDTAAHATRLRAWSLTADQGAVNEVYEAFDRDWLARVRPLYRARMLAAWYLRLERFEDPRRDEVLERVREACRATMASTDGEDRARTEHLAAVAERARLARDGDPEAHLAVARRCVRFSRRHGGTSLCLDLVEQAHALVRTGHLDEADATFAESARVARWLCIPRAEAFAVGNRAGLAGQRGDWRRAAELAERALVGVDHPYLKAVMELICAVRLAQGGHHDDLRATLERIRPVLAPVRPIDDEVQVALDAIEAATREGAPELAALASAMGQ